MPSMGPVDPQTSPQITRILVPSSSVTSGMSLRLDLLIPGWGHLESRRKIGPQLEAVHLAFRISVGHFLMDDAAAGGHPLHIPRADRAGVAQAVTVIDIACQDIGDGLDPTVRMPGESLLEILGPVVSKVVQQKKGVELAGFTEPEGATQSGLPRPPWSAWP